MYCYSTMLILYKKILYCLISSPQILAFFFFPKKLLSSETACLRTLKNCNIVKSSRNFIIKQWTHTHFSAINAWWKSDSSGDPI